MTDLDGHAYSDMDLTYIDPSTTGKKCALGVFLENNPTVPVDFTTQTVWYVKVDSVELITLCRPVINYDFVKTVHVEQIDINFPLKVGDTVYSPHFNRRFLFQEEPTDCTCSLLNVYKD